MTKRVEQAVCTNCGSTEIVRDASVIWDTSTQQWEISGIYDYIFCEGCDGETDFDFIPFE